MLTESFLRNYRAQSLIHKSFSEANAQATIFLSHSHKDKDLVQKFIDYLADISQVIVYVDWQDSDMPNATNRQTAERIKGKIREMEFFLVLATQNAMNSKWVPWEIGVADQIKPINKIALVPVMSSDGRFHGNEYLELYPTIEPTTTNNLAKFESGQTKGTNVRSWLLG